MHKPETFPTKKALAGFRKNASSCTQADADRWAAANLAEGERVVRAAFAKNVRHDGRQHMFAALKKFVESKTPAAKRA